MIEIRNLTKRFGKQVVLDNLSLNVKAGETMAIVGPSGTGKSVLLKIIIGLLVPDSGDVLIAGKSVVKAKTLQDKLDITAKLGVLFQGAALFDSLTLYENVAFPLRYRLHLPEKIIMKRSLTCMEEVGMRGYENHLPGEVSIGMRKRIGIARALVTEPEIILFDEPNTGLDPESGQEIYELIIKLQNLRKFTGVVVSHEIPEIFQVTHDVLMLYEGKIQIQCSPEEFLKSELPIVKQFAEGSISGPISMV